MVNILDTIFTKYGLSTDIKEFKKINSMIFGFILDDKNCESITKTWFPLIMPVYPANFNYDKSLFIIENNDHTDFQKVFLRKYKQIEISDSDSVSPVDGIHIETGAAIDGNISINTVPMSLELILNDKHSIIKDYYYDVIYLTSSDYHYVHFPYDCKVIGILNIPGKYSWMEPQIEVGCKFIGSNYRKVYVLQNTQTSQLSYIVMIASIIVGGINTIFYKEDGDYSKFYKLDLSNENVYAKKGDFLANFEVGSMICHIYHSNLPVNKPFSMTDRVSVSKKIKYA